MLKLSSECCKKNCCHHCFYKEIFLLLYLLKIYCYNYLHPIVCLGFWWNPGRGFAPILQQSLNYIFPKMPWWLNQMWSIGVLQVLPKGLKTEQVRFQFLKHQSSIICHAHISHPIHIASCHCEMIALKY